MEELLANGGDSLAYNRDYNLACDLTDNRTPVWTLLVHDMQWRTCLQVRFCHALQHLPPCHSKESRLQKKGSVQEPLGGEYPRIEPRINRWMPPANLRLDPARRRLIEGAWRRRGTNAR